MNQRSTVDHVDSVLKPLGPFLLCLLLSVLAILPYQAPLLHVVTPSFALIGVFYWTVNRPDLMPVAAVFFLGAIPDMWSGGPPGLQALLLIFTRLFLLGQRRFIMDRTILVSWLAFCVVALIWSIVSWGLASLYLNAVLSPWPVLAQALVNIAIYPPVSAFFRWFQTHVLE